MFLELKKNTQYRNEKRNGRSSPNLCFSNSRKKSTYIDHLQSYSIVIKTHSIILL